jgi:hypothetical protein
VKSSEEIQASLIRTDAKDRHVLSAAANGQADVLLTNNVRHFDRDEADAFGIRVETPDEFAASIAVRNPYALTKHVQRTPPERLARYLEVLSGELPETVRILAPHFND